METVITRDSDILREYLAALDARERGLSPFARLAATLKLARLRREMDSTSIEAGDEDLAALRREIDERLARTFFRRFAAKEWGGRLAALLMLVVGQQAVLLLSLGATALFIQLAPTPAWWNPVLPHDEPVFLLVFVFLVLVTAPMLALGMLFGGRYFRSWRTTVPVTLGVLAVSLLGTYLVVRGKSNPVQRSASIVQFSRQRGATEKSYSEWVEANWLTRDAKFRRDYETYLRNGPGRWITSRLKDDAAWRDALRVMNDYIDGGQDPNGFREWLKYYLDRNRIYSEDRIGQEVASITGEANLRMLGIWQVEPYLKERDARNYRAYLGAIDRSMRWWGLASLGLFTLAFVAVYFAGPLAGMWKRTSDLRGLRRSTGSSFEPAGLKERENWFPERSEITTAPFFDAPFKLLSNVHYSFNRFAASTSIVVFVFWAAATALSLGSSHDNPSSQLGFMRSNLLLAGSADTGQSADNAALSGAPSALQSFNVAAADNSSAAGRETALDARLAELERRLDDIDYSSGKKFKEQGLTLAGQRTEIDFTKSLASQLQQTTSSLPEQLGELTTRAGAIEARTGEALTDASTAKQKAEQLTTKLGEVDNRAVGAARQAGRAQEQASVLATRTEAIERELDRRARQIEARTEELGERTAELKEREERLDRLQRATFEAILGGIASDVDALDQRTTAGISRSFNKADALRSVEVLAKRISALAAELRQTEGDLAEQFVGKLEELGKQVETIAARIK